MSRRTEEEQWMEVPLVEEIEKVCRPGGFKLTDKLLRWEQESRNIRQERNEDIHVLDVGCGEGATLRYLSRLHKDWSLTGIDPCLADHRNTEEDPVFLCASAEELPFAAHSMDMVLMECSLSRVADPTKALREIHRVLKTDGRLLLSDMYRRNEAVVSGSVSDCHNSCAIGRLETSGEIRAQLKDAGFHVLRMKDHSGALGDWIAQRIMDEGTDSLRDELGIDLSELKRAKTGYYLCLAEPDPLPEVLHYAGTKSPYYREAFAGIDPGRISFEQIPFLDAEDIRSDPYAFLCVSPKDVARIITIKSSGSEGTPKRLMFTEEDMLRTADFFAWGIRSLVRPGDRVGVFMEGPSHYSIGGLLKDGCGRLPAEVSVFGWITDYRAAAEQAEGMDSLIGVPFQIYRLAREYPNLRPRTVLLSADNVPDSMIRVLEEIWGCRVFTHWGMTETGYGGGVQCRCREGYHLRDDDLLLEIVDPEKGDVRSEGETGEVVITTLRREAMPLIRYRTGDLGCLLGGTCSCGSMLPRLDRIRGRLRGQFHLPDGTLFSLPMLDEILYGKNIRAYKARWDEKREQLEIHILPMGTENADHVIDTVREEIRCRFKTSFAISLDTEYEAEGRGKRRLAAEPGE